MAHSSSVSQLSLRRRLLAILCGGFFGTLVRYTLSMLVQGWLGKGWPYDILLINLTGAFCLALVTVLAEATFLVGPTRRLLLTTGFLGAYTTFSSLALGDVLLFGKGAWLPALLYLTLSIGGGIGAVFVGNRLGWLFIARLRQQSLAGEVVSDSQALLQTEEQGTYSQLNVDR
jgi:fluoride exporter